MLTLRNQFRFHRRQSVRHGTLNCPCKVIQSKPFGFVDPEYDFVIAGTHFFPSIWIPQCSD